MPAGVCGNHVIEAGEDCDGFPDPAHAASLTCEECAYVCDPHAPTVACPTGWGCGIDGRCRHGDGTFEAASGEPVLFPSAVLLAGDRDGDAAMEVLGGSEGHVGTLTAADRRIAYSISTTFNADLLAAADLDGDGAVEVLWPSLRGGILGIRGASAGSSRPMLALGTFDVDQTTPGDQAAPPFTELVSVHLDDGSVVPYALMPQTAGLAWLDLSRVIRGAPTVTAIQGPAARLLVAVGNIDNGMLKKGDEIAIGFTGGSTIYVRRPNFDALQLVTLPAPLVADPMFGDADSDGFVDLIAPIAGQLTAVAKGDGSVLEGAASVDNRFGSPAPPACGTGMGTTVGGPPRFAATLDDNTVTDYATREGIVRGLANGKYCTAFSANTAASSSITLLDANGDGWLDVAMASGVDTKITLALNQAGAGFAGHSIPISNVPTDLRAGRFDWDAFDDLLVVEVGSDGVTHLEIAKGTNVAANQIVLSAPDAPELSSLASGGFDDDGVDDLVLLGREPDREDPYLARVSLLGEGTDFFSQIGGPSLGQVSRILIGAVTSTPARNDVVVLFADQVHATTDIWLFPDQGSYLTDRAATEVAILDGVDPRSAVLADVDGDGGDELVTVVAEHLAIIDLNSGSTMELPVPATEVIALTTVRRDQRGDCVVITTAAGASLACDLRGAATSEDFPSSPVFGAVSADVDADGSAEVLLVLASEVVVYALDPIAERGRFPLGASHAGPAAVCTGDLDGDGVDDLAVGAENTIELFWGVPAGGAR